MRIHGINDNGMIVCAQALLDGLVTYADVREGDDGSVFLHFVEGDYTL